MTDKMDVTPFIYPHPSEFIKDEMEARGWDIGRLATAMGGDYGLNYLAMDIYFIVGPEKTNCRLGRLSGDLSRAFGISPDFFVNLETGYLKWVEKTRTPKEKE